MPLLVSSILFACNNSQEVSPDTSLSPVGFGNVEIGGELAERIARNFDRMESEFYQPEQVYWTEEESNGWPADKEGRTILALVLDARASGRQPKYLNTLIEMLPEHLNEKGYMGTIHQDIDEQQLSGHGWLLRGLCEYHEWTGDTTVMNIAKGIVDNLFLPVSAGVDRYPIDPKERVAGVGDMSGSTQNTIGGWRLSSDIGCVFIGMEGLIHYYKYNRDPKVKALIDQLIGLFLKIDLVGIKAQTHATLTALRGIMRYSQITGDMSLLSEVQSRWNIYKEHGMTENFENYNWFDRCDTWTEPCAIVDSYILAVQLWQATRNPQYLADAERIYYNGICATQRSNGGFGCDKPVGREFDNISIHADEAYWCCTMRGGEGLGRVAEYSYFAAGDTLFVPFYHQSRVRVPEKNLVLDQTSDYPFGDMVSFYVTETPETPVTLALGAPAYMNVDSLTVNGVSADYDRADGFVTVLQPFEAGDKIQLHYSFTAGWTPLICDSTRVKAMYGPLVLAADGGKEVTEVSRDSKVLKADGQMMFADSISCGVLSPLYHLMSPKVALSEGYDRKVIYSCR